VCHKLAFCTALVRHVALHSVRHWYDVLPCILCLQVAQQQGEEHKAAMQQACAVQETIKMLQLELEDTTQQVGSTDKCALRPLR